MTRTALTAYALVAFVSSAAAQTSMKLDGKVACAKPEQQHVVEVKDAEKHAMILGEAKCTWTSGALGGQQLKDEVDTFSSDATGNSSNDKGYGVGGVANGDKYYVHFKGTSTLKDGAPVTAECTWKFTGGTGTLSGIKGKGTCKGTFQKDGAANWEIKGDYQLAASAGK
jgi:hypothetical protein